MPTRRATPEGWVVRKGWWAGVGLHHGKLGEDLRGREHRPPEVRTRGANAEMGSQGGAGKLGVLTHQPLNLGQRPTPEHLVGSSWSQLGVSGCPQTVGRQAVGSWGPQIQRGPCRIPAHWAWTPVGRPLHGRHPHFSCTEAQQASDSVQQIQTLPPEKSWHHTSHGPVRRRWPRTPRAWGTDPPRWLVMEGRPLSQGWPGQGRPFPARLGTTTNLGGGPAALHMAAGCI